MEPRHVPPFLTILALLLAGLAAHGLALHGITPFQDDAGSGADAPDQPVDALPLPDGPDAYEGNLTGPADADWYALSGSASATCLEASVDGGSLANATLAAERPGGTLPIDETPHAEGTHDPVEGLDLGLAVPGTSSPSSHEVYLGLEPQYTLADEGAPEIGLGGYGFDLAVTTIDQVDADPVPGDAPARDAAGKAPAVPSSCFAGALDPTGSDDADAYSLEADAGDRLTLSLAVADGEDPSATLELGAPGGGDVLSLDPGEVKTTVLETAGKYTLSIWTPDTGALTYGVGATQDDDDPPPCRPNCME